MASRKSRAKHSREPWIAGALALVVTASFVAAILWGSTRLRERAADSAAIAPPAPTPSPADWALPADLPALPVPTTSLPRPAVAVRAAYEFAARQPEVLRQLPCFCGCRRLGHRSNHDCFVAARAPGGRVTWDAHGMG